MVSDPTPNPAELTAVRAGARNQLTGEHSTTEHPLGPCVWAPAGGSNEQSPRSEIGQQVVTRREVYPTDPAPDVRSTDRIRFPGETGAPWLVVGDVEQWTPPWPGPAGSKFVVERTTG